MPFCKPSLLATCCLLSILPLKADVIFLKNGEKMEGVILSEEGENYVIEVKVTATIRDEKIIPRTDVLRIEKERPDVTAFAGIADLAPAPELLEKEAYEDRVARIEAFLKEHPASPMADKAKKMAEELKAELEVIAAGGIKFGEELLTAEEHAANAYAYDARIAEKWIRDAVSRRDLLGALRRFDAYETAFAEPEGRDGLAALMLQVLGSYRASIADSLATLDSRIKARELGLERMSADDKARSQRALQTEAADITKRLQEEKAARVKWVTPHAFSKESLDEAQRQVASEITRLERQPTAPAIPLAEVYSTAWEKLGGGTDEEKKAVLDDAKAKKLPEAYLAKLRERSGLPVE